MKPDQRRRPERNLVRIIGGRWRRRRLLFPDVADLRPTPDRVRETLFNWLRDDLDGARCLDLFAGSGALGFEAASRGAARVVLVESAPAAVTALRQSQAALGAVEAEVLAIDAESYLDGPAERFDLVFLDPPYRRGDLPALCARLQAGAWLAPRAKVYLETDRPGQLASLPASWQLLRGGDAGEVAYFVYQCVG